MNTHKTRPYTAGPAPAVLSILLALGPAFLFYLLVLQGPVISLVRLGLAALGIPLFAYPVFDALSHGDFLKSKRLFLIGSGAAILALMGMQAISLFPAKVWPFFGRHSLTLVPSGSNFELRGLRTSLAPVSYEALEGLETWKRIENRLIPGASPPGALSWSGWTGDSLKLDFSGEPGAVVQVRIDDHVQEYRVSAGEDRLISLQRHFDLPVWGKALVFLTLWLALCYTVVLFSFFLESGWDHEVVLPGKTVRALLFTGALAGAVLLVLRVYLPVHPQLVFPDRDSGFFLYSGRQILEGRIPYKDFWDHKGPLIYYLNALGLFLGGDSANGVWALEVAWIAASLLCLYLLLRDIAGELPACLGIFIFLLGLGNSLGGGNFTEEYGLLFTILCLYLFWLYLKDGKSRWIFLCGLMGGVAFLLRPNGFGAAIGIGGVLLFRPLSGAIPRRRRDSFLVLAAGAAAPVLLILLYLSPQHAVSDMFSAVILFNRGYAGPLRWTPLEDFQRGLFGMPWLGFWILAGLAALLSVLLTSRPGTRLHRFIEAFLLAALAELILSNLSRVGYKHYYIAWLPYAGILAAFFGSHLMNMLGAAPPAWKGRAVNLAYLAAAVLVLSRMPPVLDQLSKYFPLDWLQSAPQWDTEDRPLNRLRAYVNQDSKLLMWGNEAAYNFLLDLESPDRFVYQYPLMRPGYATPSMVAEFVSSLQRELPVIVDASPGNPDAIPLEPVRRLEMLSQPGNGEKYHYLQLLFEYIDDRYHPAGRISKNWVVLSPD